MNAVFALECVRCGDSLEGAKLTEVVEDSYRLGWERRPDGLVCAGCVDEEAAL